MMKYCLALLTAVCTISTQAMTLDELQKKLQEPAVVRANFEQIRTISTMKKPLVSSGRAVISKEKGIWWSQEKPFQLVMLFSNDKMIQKMSGQDAVVITAQSQPQLFQFNYLMRALLEADQNVLQQNFKLSLQNISAKQWQLTLIPKTLPLDKLFSHIVLSGAEFIDSVTLFDLQGDKTEIRFLQQTHTPAVLSDEEKHNFAGQ